MAWVHPPAIGCRFSFLHIPCGRCGHTTSLYNTSLLVFGGFDGKKWLNDLHKFDTSSLVWSQPRVLGPSPTPRQYHAASVISDRLFIFGGYNGVGWLKDLVVLDLAFGTWTYPKTVGDVPTGREGHTMVAADGFLYVHGGWDGGTIGDLYRLRLSSFCWEKIEISGFRPNLCGHSCNLVDNTLFIFGGFDGNSWENKLYRLRLDAFRCEVLETKGEPIPRGYHSATMVNRYILIYAGYNGKFILGDLVALDTESLVWSLPDPCLGHFPSARNAHTVTLLGSELFMFGGYNGSRDTNELHILETAAFSTLQDDLKQALGLAAGSKVVIGSKGYHRTVHTAILAARCEQLVQNTEKIDLRISQKALDVLVEYLYCDIAAEKIPFECLEELSNLAYRLKLDRLRALCDEEADVPDSTLTGDIMRIRADTTNADFVVIIENKEFLLHKVILSARCSYFRALFESGMSETSSNTLKLDYFKAGAFEYIIEWIYSDKFSPLVGEAKVPDDTFIDILFESNMLGLESLMRMTELAAEGSINIENVAKLFEVAHSLGATRLKSYAINFILREFDRLSIKRELLSLSDTALEELNGYLPRRMKRQTSKPGIFPSLSLVKLDKKLTIKPHNPKSIREPSRDLKGRFALLNPLNCLEIKNRGRNISPQPAKKNKRKDNRAHTFQYKETNNRKPVDFMVQGVSPRSNNSVERMSVLQHAGMHISSSLGTLYQHALAEFSAGSRFLLYK